MATPLFPGRISTLLDSNEIPSESEARCIQGLLSTGRARRVRFHAELTATNHTVTSAFRDKLISELDALDRQLSKYKAALSPLRQLPTEIISLIFTYAIRLPRGDPSRDLALWTIGQVCTRWRAVALSQPLLWTIVDLDLSGGPDKSRFRLETQLQRSREFPLRITLRCSVMDHYRKEKKLINMLVEHCSRWETFEMSFPTERQAGFLNSTIPRRFPLLRELNFRVYPTFDPSLRDDESSFVCEYFEDAPNLRTVVVDCRFVETIKVPFPQLLRYRGTNTWGGHLSNLRSACNLVDCALNIKGVGNLPAMKISLLHLHRLAVTNSLFLDCLDAPALQELHCSGPTSHIVSFLQSVPCKLQKLFLHECAGTWPPPDFGPLLRAVPMLAHLGIQFIDPFYSKELYSLLILPTTAEMVHLKTISICLQRLRHASVDPTGLFMDMLESRWRAGSLRSVDFCGYFPSRYASRMDRLRDEGLKVVLDNTTYKLLLDMTPPHLQLHYNILIM